METLRLLAPDYSELGFRFISAGRASDAALERSSWHFDFARLTEQHSLHKSGVARAVRYVHLRSFFLSPALISIRDEPFGLDRERGRNGYIR